MTEPRPTILPDAVAVLTAAAPRRIVAKLDAEPGMAGAWAWADGGDTWTVTAPGGEVVTLKATNGCVRTADDVRCSCLLSPKCLHALAVVTSLAVGGLEETSEPEPADAGPEPAGAALTDEQMEAARLAWRAGSEILAAGASAAGAIAQAELLRAVHACRASGLHRAAAAGLRVVQAIRDLRDERPEFALAALAAHLFDLLDTAHTLSGGAPADPARIGVARRSYSTVGNLRLRGLFTEAVIAPGYAGVVTYLADDSRRVWTVPDVLPGEAVRAVGAYEAPAGLGDASLPHRELGRDGLLVQNATGSADMRLGAGAAVRAVRSGPSSWRDSTALWDEPLGEQLGRAFSGAEGGLLFARGRVVGAGGDDLVVAIEHDGSTTAIRLIAASGHAALAYRDNMRLLARAPGLGVSLVARVVPDRARTAVLLAVGAGDDEEATDGPRLRLPVAWGGRCNVGLDRLTQSYVTSARPAPERVELVDPIDPLESLRRRVTRFALGGRATLPPEALAIVEREAVLLERRLMPAGARALRALGAAAVTAARTTSGERRAGDAELLASRWLSIYAYDREASRVLRRASWG